MPEITLKDIYDIVGQSKTELKSDILNLDNKVEKYHLIFRNFEEGRVNDLIKLTEKHEAEIKELKGKIMQDDKQEETTKERIWKVVEKVIWIILGAIVSLGGLVLKKLGIINWG